MRSAHPLVRQLFKAIGAALRSGMSAKPYPDASDTTHTHGTVPSRRHEAGQHHPTRHEGDVIPPAGPPHLDLDDRPGYPGDFTGVPEMQYAPHDDSQPDPGEIVWTWVPFEEDHSQGKDRPVLLIGWDGKWLLACPLTSKDHDRDAAQEARAGRLWFDIGSGAWDSSGRPSEVRVNRIIRVDPYAVRREGTHLDEALFSAVAEEIRRAMA